MTDYRYNLLMEGPALLTEQELAAGWHFCAEFDGLLVGPGMGELRLCCCLHALHPVYKTAPKEEPLQIDENNI